MEGKRVLFKKTKKQLQTLQRFYDNGMTNAKKENINLIHQAMKETGLEYEKVTQWIDNQKKKKKRKENEAGEKLYQRQPSSYDMFRAHKMKNDSLNDTRQVNHEWNLLSSVEKEHFKEEAKSVKLPKLCELTDHLKEKKIRCIRNKIVRMCNDLKELGVDTCYIDYQNDCDRFYLCGSEEGIDFGTVLELEKKFPVHLIGEEMRQNIPRKRLAEFVKEELNKKFKELTGGEYSHVRYSQLGKRFSVHGMPPGIFLKAPTEMSLQDLQRVKDNLEEIYFAEIPPMKESSTSTSKEHQQTVTTVHNLDSLPSITLELPELPVHNHNDSLTDNNSLEPRIMLSPVNVHTKTTFKKSVIKMERNSSLSSSESEDDVTLATYISESHVKEKKEKH